MTLQEMGRIERKMTLEERELLEKHRLQSEIPKTAVFVYDLNPDKKEALMLFIGGRCCYRFNMKEGCYDLYCRLFELEELGYRIYFK